MEIQINKIKPNPYKKFINKGKLNQNQVDKLKESIKHGTLPSTFCVNKKNELCFGHHRLEAFKQEGVKKITIELRDYTDEQMLIDLVRENLTQRFNEFREELDSVLLAKDYLENRPTGGQFKATHKDETGAREIAKFLSKEGKAISKSKVADVLKIHKNLAPEILDKVTKYKGAEKKDEGVTIKQAQALSNILDKKEQKDLMKAMKNSREQLGWKQKELIKKYEKAPENIKEKICLGVIDLADVKIAKNFGTTEELFADKVAEVQSLFQSLGRKLESLNLAKLTKHQNEILQRTITINFKKRIIPFLIKLWKDKGKVVFEIQ